MASRSSTDSSTNFAAVAREKLNDALFALKSATASTQFDDGGANIDGAGGAADDSFTKSSFHPTTAGLDPAPSSSMESPVESEPPIVASVCGGAATDVAEGGEATIQNLLRLIFGSCTSGVEPPPHGRSSAGKISAKDAHHRPARSHQRGKGQEDAEDDDVDVEREGRSRANTGSSRRSKKSHQGSSRRSGSNKGDGKGRNRERDVPLTQIETEKKDESFYASFYADDHARLKAEGHRQSEGESGSPASPVRRQDQQQQVGAASTPKQSLEAQAAIAAQGSTEDLIRQANGSPYRVSEVPRPPPAASMDEADAESFCFDDGISALSAHTLEEMAKANPPPRKVPKKIEPPVEEGFDITIDPSAAAAGVPPGKSESISEPTSKSSSPLPTPSAAKTDGSDAAAAAASSSSSSKDEQPGGEPQQTSAAAVTPLRSKSRLVVDSSAEIRDVDESGDGVGALPPPSPADVSRMRSTRSTRTHGTTGSRTTQTSASSHEFESAWRRDEAQFWEEEARKEAVAIDVIGEEGDVDEDGFPVQSSADVGAAAAPFTPTKIGPAELAKARKQLNSRSRSNDLTAPTSAMTANTTICTSPSTLTSISPNRHHPHDTIPLDLSDCVPSTSCTAGSGTKIKRRKSRRQRLHDGLVRRGRLIIKGGGYLPQENSTSPTNEIFIRNDVEVGEI